jgi:hypothetical protein
MVFKSWTTSEVCRHLQTLGFGDYVDVFATNEIIGIHLPRLTEDHLKEFGILSVGHRILLLRRFSDIAHGRSVSSLPPAPGAPPSKPSRPIAAAPSLKRKAAVPLSPLVADALPRSPPAAVADARPRPKSATRDDRSDSSSGHAAEQRSPGVRPSRTATPEQGPPARDNHSESSSGHGNGTEFGVRRTAQKDERQIMASHRAGQTFAAAGADDDQKVTCQYCGNEMKPDAARRHIPVCGRMNGGKIAKK